MQVNTTQDDYGVGQRSNICTRGCGEHENDGHERHERHTMKPMGKLCGNIVSADAKSK